MVLKKPQDLGPSLLLPLIIPKTLDSSPHQIEPNFFSLKNGNVLSPVVRNKYYVMVQRKVQSVAQMESFRI